MESVLTKNQKRKETSVFIENGKKYRADLEIRYDDECGNGHNTFSMTYEVYQIHANGRKTNVGWGPANVAPEVMEHFPKFKKFLKWHMFNSNGPQDYISNTIYFAGDVDCWGRKKGDPCAWDSFLKFKGFPVSFKFGKKFLKALSEYPNKKYADVLKVDSHDPTKYKPKFTFGFYKCEWYECPFDTNEEACEFLEAIKKFDFEIIEKPTAFSDGKAREFDLARQEAFWPEATDEILSLPKEELKKVLEDRLPALIEEFKTDVESLGFVF